VAGTRRKRIEEEDNVDDEEPLGVYTNPTQRHNYQKSVNPTHPGKPARRSANPTHFAASNTVFRKSDTIPGNPTHRSAIVAWQ
jgi:hypothetical protein